MYLHLTVILMLISMLSHTVLGCGWHHAHDCRVSEQDTCQTMNLCQHESGHAEHGHKHSHAQSDQCSQEPDQQDPVHQDSDPCQEGRCSYLVVTSVKVHEESPQLISLMPLWDDLFSAREKQYVDRMPFFSTAAVFLSPGVRAQSLTTVWLI
ncbi:hypothetical protein Pan161_43940 [Gimesia algae]|uniref:Uncharacterized protein n=2 Tax=Gimesia algae TaxID=2527971 RepID=A0A517VI82_9PLAN|nr:hypothetical protein Pan161_43940 [Gimesia algae]